MGLEERCGDEDMHVSTARIPIIHEHPLDVTDGDSIEDSKIMDAIPQNQLPRTIYAPLGDAEFWIGIHLGLVEYALRVAEQSILEKHIVDARIVLVQNDLYRQFRDKLHLSNELEDQKTLSEQERKENLSRTALIISKYVLMIYEKGLAEYRHELEIQKLEKEHELDIQLLGLRASNEIEGKENIIRMYEERFGTRQELERLAQAEENTKLPGMLGPRKYADISTLIKQHETGERYTLGDRIFSFADRLLSPKTYSDIAAAVYNAFTGKSRENDSCG